MLEGVISSEDTVPRKSFRSLCDDIFANYSILGLSARRYPDDPEKLVRSPQMLTREGTFSYRLLYLTFMLNALNLRLLCTRAAAGDSSDHSI